MLRVENLRKVFYKQTVDEVTALADVSLTLAAGDFVTIIGSNGAGKSTLLNLIAGVYPSDAGFILLGDWDITFEPEHERARAIGRVYQDPKVNTAARMSIEENLAMAARRGEPRRLRKGVTGELRERFREVLRPLELGLEDRLHNRVDNLSGGQRQALALVMASISKPKLLLLDEHAASLDPKTARKILEITDQLIERESLTTLMVTHNMEQALKHGNRLVMMHRGRIVLDIAGREKSTLTVRHLIEKFEHESGDRFLDDRVLLPDAT